MPKNLKRYSGRGDFHYITFSCYRRLSLLGSTRARNVFVRTLNQVRRELKFKLVGFVVMPNHVHLLIGETSLGTPSKVLQSLKLRISKRMRGRPRRPLGQRTLPFLGDEAQLPQFWQKRFYDFNVWSRKKLIEKLQYMHQNPVVRKLVSDPKDWVWSSYSSYSGRGTPLIEIDFVN